VQPVVYSVAKTVADCFKYRGKIESNVLSQAVEEYLKQRKCTRERLLHFVRICRVESVWYRGSPISAPNVRCDEINLLNPEGPWVYKRAHPGDQNGNPG